MQSAAPNADPARELLATARRRGRRYRIGAGVILLLGAISAGLVYWLGSRGQGSLDDPSMIGFNRATDHQMAYLYGKQGELVEDLIDLLKQPGTQAVLIVVATALIAAGCFFFARMLEYEATVAANDVAPLA
jgi:hypothetical protein